MDLVEYHLQCAAKACTNEVLKEKIKGLLNSKALVGFKIQRETDAVAQRKISEEQVEDPDLKLGGRGGCSVSASGEKLCAKKNLPPPPPETMQEPEGPVTNNHLNTEPKTFMLGSSANKKCLYRENKAILNHKSGELTSMPRLCPRTRQEVSCLSAPQLKSRSPTTVTPGKHQLSEQEPEANAKEEKPNEDQKKERPKEEQQKEMPKEDHKELSGHSVSSWECKKCGRLNTLELMCCNRMRPLADDMWRCPNCKVDNGVDRADCWICERRKPKKRARKEFAEILAQIGPERKSVRVKAKVDRYIPQPELALADQKKSNQHEPPQKCKRTRNEKLSGKTHNQEVTYWPDEEAKGTKPSRSPKAKKKAVDFADPSSMDSKVSSSSDSSSGSLPSRISKSAASTLASKMCRSSKDSEYPPDSESSIATRRRRRQVPIGNPRRSERKGKVQKAKPKSPEDLQSLGVSKEEIARLPHDKYITRITEFIEKGDIKSFYHYTNAGTRDQAIALFSHRETTLVTHPCRGYGVLHRALVQHSEEFRSEIVRSLVQLALQHQLKQALDGTTDKGSCRFVQRRRVNQAAGGVKFLDRVRKGMSSPFKSATALHLACMYGDLESASILIHAGCNPDAVNREGRTALSIALEAVDAPMVKLLTSSPHCSLNGVGVGGCTSALDWILPMVRLKAVCEAALTITRYLCVRLIRQQQRPEVKSLFWAVASCPENQRGEKSDMQYRWLACSYLIEFMNKEDLELENGYIKTLKQKKCEYFSEGWNPGYSVSPLHVAVQACNYRLLSRLLQPDRDYNLHLLGGEKENFTPLHMACMRGWVEGTGLLIARGADVNVRGKRGQTALMIACGSGNATLVTLLVTLARPEVDYLAKDGAGWTCFHYAAASGRVAVLDQLLAFHPLGIKQMLTETTERGQIPYEMLKSALATAQKSCTKPIKEMLARLDKKVAVTPSDQLKYSWRKYQRSTTTNMLTGIWAGEEDATAQYQCHKAKERVPHCVDTGLARGFIYVSYAIESEGTCINWNPELMNWCPCDGWQCPPACPCQSTSKALNPRGSITSQMELENIQEMLRCVFLERSVDPGLQAGENSYQEVYRETLRKAGITAVDEALNGLVHSQPPSDDELANHNGIRRHAMRWLIQRTLLYAQKNKIIKKDSSERSDPFSDMHDFCEIEESRLAQLLLTVHDCIEESAFAPGWHPLDFNLEENEPADRNPGISHSSYQVVDHKQACRSFAWRSILKKDNIILVEIWEKLQELKSNIDLNHVSQPSSYYDEFGRKDSNHRTIKECNYRCLCDMGEGGCKHQLVQLGCKEGLEIFWTGQLKGFGVRTTLDIKKNTYLFEYAGEYVTEDEFKRRQQQYIDRQLRMQYQLCLGKIYIDATRYGNVGRFMNHSCEPNVKAFEVFTDHHDTSFPRIGFFALKNVQAGEELTWSYGSVHEQATKTTDFPCHCESSKCKGFLPT